MTPYRTGPDKSGSFFGRSPFRAQSSRVQVAGQRQFKVGVAKEECHGGVIDAFEGIVQLRRLHSSV